MSGRSPFRRTRFRPDLVFHHAVTTNVLIRGPRRSKPMAWGMAVRVRGRRAPERSGGLKGRPRGVGGSEIWPNEADRERLKKHRTSYGERTRVRWLWSCSKTDEADGRASRRAVVVGPGPGDGEGRGRGSPGWDGVERSHRRRPIFALISFHKQDLRRIGFDREPDGRSRTRGRAPAAATGLGLETRHLGIMAIIRIIPEHGAL